ncbi:SDR family oxidoreductase [Streptomyces sedi]|uniref:SDR family oxidoreductase n=1 Tax=Streptomyces sedi TaxID=555059 RepID=A0A5C4V5F2_9ACTN|nr:SDR family oxidoreductase [Streptomyces sedi]TNM31097.1 SDR family oxidoreductase [Streptomyces sedi]
MTTEYGPLAGRIALVAGATRGAGRAMAVELGRAGATVYVTGRTTRSAVSEVGRSAETIEETGELVTAAGGEGIAVPTDHLQPEQVRALVERIDRERGRLDILVNDIWGGEHLIDVSVKKRMWEFGLEPGLRMLRLGVETHIVTSHFALPLLVRNEGGLLIEVTDGTSESNAAYRESFYYDLTKFAPLRMVLGLGQELKEFGGAAVCVTPGFLRSEQMLESAFGVTEENWRDAIAQEPHFAISETPTYLGRGVAALAADPERARFNGRSLDSGTLAREYGLTDVDGSRPDCWGYLSRVLAGEKADPADYR